MHGLHQDVCDRVKVVHAVFTHHLDSKRIQLAGLPYVTHHIDAGNGCFVTVPNRDVRLIRRGPELFPEDRKSGR